MKNQKTKIQNIIGGGYRFQLNKPYIGGQAEIASYPDTHVNNQNAGGYRFDLDKGYIGGQAEITSYPDFHINNQKGGGYNYILNPLTNRKVSIYGKIGKNIISNYLKNLK